MLRDGDQMIHSHSNRALALLSTLLLSATFLVGTGCTEEQVSDRRPDNNTRPPNSSDFQKIQFKDGKNKNRTLNAIYDKRNNKVTITTLPETINIEFNARTTVDHGAIAKDQSLTKGCQDILDKYRVSLRTGSPFVFADRLKTQMDGVTLESQDLVIDNDIQTAVLDRIKIPKNKPLPQIEFPPFELRYKKARLSFQKFYPPQDQSYKELIDLMSRDNERPISFALTCDLLLGTLKATGQFQINNGVKKKVRFFWY